jgi:hypothetical protein
MDFTPYLTQLSVGVINAVAVYFAIRFVGSISKRTKGPRAREVYGSDESYYNDDLYYNAGARWDAEDIDRHAATFRTDLPGRVAKLYWLDIPEGYRLKLRRVIDRMPNKPERQNLPALPKRYKNEQG